MRKTRISILVVVLLCILATAGVVSAEMFSANYGVPWDARWGGGGHSSSDNYGVGAGYWYHVIGEYEIYLPLLLRESAP